MCRPFHPHPPRSRRCVVVVVASYCIYSVGPLVILLNPRLNPDTANALCLSVRLYTQHTQNVFSSSKNICPSRRPWTSPTRPILLGTTSAQAPRVGATIDHETLVHLLPSLPRSPLRSVRAWLRRSPAQ